MTRSTYYIIYCVYIYIIYFLYIYIHCTDTYVCVNICMWICNTYVPQHVAEREGDDEELRDAVERRERQCVHLCMRP